MKLLGLLFCIFSLTISFTQTTTVVAATTPNGLAKIGNDLFYAEFITHKIVKTDLTAGTPVPVDYITGLNNPSGLAVLGNFMYVAEYGSDKISKIDMTSGSPVAVDFVTGLNNPVDVMIVGFYLYVTEADKITKIDVTSGSPVASDVITGLSLPTQLAQYGNFIYYTDGSANKIQKFDHTSGSPVAIDVITGLGNPNGLAFYNDEILVSEVGTHMVSHGDATITTPILSTIISSGLSFPVNLLVDGTILYIADNQNSRIAKYELAVAKLDEVAAPSLSIYPNPSQKLIKISGIETAMNYSIVNLLGEVLMQGTAKSDFDLNIEGLSNGQYIVQFENGQNLQFIKE